MKNGKWRKHTMPNTETAESNISDRMSDIRSGAENVRKQFDKSTDQLKSKAEDAWQDLIDVVKKHPGKALGITLGAGVALGTLLALSKKRNYSASDQFKGLAGTGVDAWDRVKTGFDDAICTLKDALGDAAGKFK
jgi:ElaB/YqjD/DUF883 family membrane-anchored ribosome-binding protein